MSEKPRSERAVAAKSKEKEKEQAPEDRSLPVLPVRDTVLFPHAVLPLTVGRESSVQLINSLGEDKTVIVVAQREARVDSPQPTDLYTVGSLAVVFTDLRESTRYYREVGDAPAFAAVRTHLDVLRDVVRGQGGRPLGDRLCGGHSTLQSVSVPGKVGAASGASRL